MRIAHLSDLHFSTISFSIDQFFSKRWIGNVNLLFSRKKAFSPKQLFPLISLFKEQQIDYVLITGDLSTTSLTQEFREALHFIESLEKTGIRVFVLPGNHDHYTKQAYKERHFYTHFPCSALKQEGVSKDPLEKGWWLVRLDTALATSLFSSRGSFTPLLETALRHTLDSIPKEDKILLANHFPLFQEQSKRKILLGANTLEKLLLHYPNVVLYLHGHTHRQAITDARTQGLPILVDSGSSSHAKKGSLNLITLSQEGGIIDLFQHNKLKKWQLSAKHSFNWHSPRARSLIL